MLSRFAPERRHTPFDEWPPQDQEMWRGLIAQGATILDESGAFASLRPRTIDKKRQSYSTWLSFLQRHDRGSMALAPNRRVTRETTGAWFDRLGVTVAPYTRLLRAVDLVTVMAGAFPEQDWTWLRRAVARLQRGVAPSDRKAGRIRPSTQLLELGRQLMAKADQALAAEGRDGHGWHAVRYRDGLIVALLALRPLRVRNLLGLEIGRTLLPTSSGTYLIAFDGSETKTREPIEATWPEDLEAALRRYLEVHRPRLLGYGRHTALWIGMFGAPLVEQTMRVMINDRTRAGLGVAISPHLFRDCAATTIAILDPAHIGVAASLLGHATISTTDRHYRQASCIAASRRYLETQEQLRRQLRPVGGGRRHRPRRAGKLLLLSSLGTDRP